MMREPTIEHASTSRRIYPIGVVVLHYRNIPDTKECLESLHVTDPRPQRIIVVDNHSDAGSHRQPNEIPASDLNISVIHPGCNLGYAGGMNLGIKTLLTDSRLQVIVLLNNDTVVEPDFLRPLFSTLRNGSNYHLSTPMILLDRSDRIWSAGERVWYPFLWAKSSAANAGRGGGGKIMPINSVTGCAMAVRREVFERIGLFDEQYFAYVEDVDFCMRAHSAGFRFTCCPASIVYHKVSSSLGDFSPAKVYLNVRNKAYFIRKNIPPIWWPLSWPWYFLTVLSWAIRAIVKGRLDVVRSILLAGRDAIRGRMGPPPRWV